MACLSWRRPALERTNTPRTRRAIMRMRKGTSMTLRQHPLPRGRDALPPAPTTARDAIVSCRFRDSGLLALGVILVMLIVSPPAGAHVNVDVGDGQYVMEL